MAPTAPLGAPAGMHASARAIAARLTAAGDTLALCETAAGGLLSAALLAAPGASSFFVGSVIAYSRTSRRTLLDLTAEDVAGLAPMSEAIALVFADRVRARLGTTWGLAELGIAGPAPSPYGGPAGEAVLALSGPVTLARRVQTGRADRDGNMGRFA
ncbi:MAG: CinA family protein, partial [Pseudomonadales bacterium]|nr:CinA family protein [Pseudomonadales bacterium]